MQAFFKTLFLFLAGVSISLLGSAQPQSVKVSGLIKPYDPTSGSSKVFLQSYDPLNAAWLSVDGVVGPDGKFEASLPVFFVQQMRLIWGSESISFKGGPEDALQVVLNAQAGAEFSGPHADWNNRMQRYQMDYTAALSAIPEPVLLGEQGDTTSFLANWKTRLEKENNWADKYLRKTKAPADFVKWAKDDIHFRFAEERRAAEFGNRTDLPWSKIDQWIEKYRLNEGLVGNAAFLEHGFKFLQNFYGAVSTQLKSTGKTQESDFIAATLDSLMGHYHGFIRESQLSNVFMGLARQVSPDEVPWLKDRWAMYKKEFDHSVMRKEVVRLAELRKRTDPSFDEVMAKHRGKVVVIDCWATWCGPCRVQLPFMHTLKDSLAGEAVDFVYFSFDRDQQKWQDFLQKEQLQGEHYLLSGGRLANDVNTRFQVSGIPRYILVDKEGNVANANAPRPGTISSDRQWVFNPVLLAEIRKLLAK